MNSKGFFGSLFDFSFEEFITPKIVSVLYVIGMIIAAIFSLFIMISAFRTGVAAGIIALLLIPVYFMLIVISIRVYMEIIIILFKIYEGINALNSQGGNIIPPKPPAGS